MRLVGTSLQVLSLAVAMLACSVAHAQSVFDDVDECDLLAAHPSDPERMADGAADDAIVPRLAVAACDAAAKRAPDVPRFAFQLGRALSAADRPKEATEQFRKAADKDYGAAYAYLGDAYQFGHGVTVDEDKALAAYQKAQAKGFGPAAGQVDMLVFDPDLYVTGVLGALYASDLGGLRDPNLPVLSYLFSLVMALGTECGAILKPQNVTELYNRRYKRELKPEEEMQVAIFASLAEYDSKIFLKRHGCDGPVAGRVRDHLNQLYTSSGR